MRANARILLRGRLSAVLTIPVCPACYTGSRERGEASLRQFLLPANAMRRDRHRPPYVTEIFRVSIVYALHKYQSSTRSRQEVQ